MTDSRVAPAALGDLGWGERIIASLLVVIAALCLCAGSAQAALTFPPLTGRVVDDAHVLAPDVAASLTQKLADLQAKTSRQLVVVTLSSLQGDDIADYGYQLGRAWGIGQKSLNNGTLFIVAPSEHKVRIEVGYGLEPILTDALTSQILQEAVLPRFRAGDISGGVVAGSDRLIDQLGADPSTAEQKAANAQRAPAQAQTSSHVVPALFGLILPIVFFFLVVSGLFRGGRGGGFLPGLLVGGLLGGVFGGNSDNDDGGGGGGGGGFSGGGGSFGGGGSSGNW